MTVLATDLLKDTPGEGIYCYVKDDAGGVWTPLPQSPESGDYLEVRLSLLDESSIEAAFYQNRSGKSIGPLLILPFVYEPNAE